MKRIVAETDFDELPTVGSRHNVFLTVLTIAAYHALLDMGIGAARSAALTADIGWRIYAWLLVLPVAVARIVTRDPQRRINLVLRMLLRFPFSTAGRPGYEARAWREPGRFYTHFSHCPAWTWVRRYVEHHGDRGEKDAFVQSWCTYDWAAAELMSGRSSSYQRPHTLSRGDLVCDMCWSANNKSVEHGARQESLVSIVRQRTDAPEACSESDERSHAVISPVRPPRERCRLRGAVRSGTVPEPMNMRRTSHVF